MERLNRLLPYFEIGANAWGIPSIFTGIHALKIPRNWLFLLTGYFLSLSVYIFLHYIPFGPVFEYPTVLTGGFLLILFVISPIITALFYSAPLQKPSSCIKKYPQFILYTIIYIFIIIAIALVLTFIEFILVHFYGKIASTFWFPIKLGILYFFDYKFFLAPAYIAIRNDAGGVFSLLFSWEFTRQNWDAAGFYIKRLVAYLIIYGLFLFFVYGKENYGLDVPLIFIASYYFIIVLYLFIVSASTTILLHRQIKRRGDIGEWIGRRYNVSLIVM